MAVIHSNLAAGAWQRLSLAEQLGNVGSEVSRARMRQSDDPDRFLQAMDRALELLDLTIQDSRWRFRLKELTRTREFLCDALTGGSNYQATLDELDRYFLTFAIAARLKK